tara:strand:+ start:979 stop:1728 length:750 start_codon:yes stop_codon:yes gene_type:complete
MDLKMKCFKLLAMMAGVFVASNVYAEPLSGSPVWTNTNDGIDFYSTDFYSEGDGLATLDYSTGIEWMDVGLTAGLSVSQVEAMTQTGGIYEGWRLPSYQEVTTFFNNWFDYDTDGETERTGAWATFSSSASWTSTFSNVVGRTEGTRSYGLYNGVNGRPLLFGVAEFSNDTIFFNYRDSGILTENDANDFYGVWLVSDGGDTLSSKQNPMLNINNENSPVNSVPVVGLAALSLFGMGMGVRRRGRCFMR